MDSPSQYFPLTYTVFASKHSLWGLNPAGYHWVNILLHAINAVLVWLLLKRLSVPGRLAGGGPVWPASGAGGIGRLDHGIEKCLVALVHLVDAVLPGLNLSGNDPAPFGMGWRWVLRAGALQQKRRPAPCRRRCC